MTFGAQNDNLIPLWYHRTMAMTLRTDSALEAALEALTAAEGVSRQEVVRRAVLERARRAERKDVIEGLTAEALEEWADTLHRLGTV